MKLTSRIFIAVLSIFIAQKATIYFDFELKSVLLDKPEVILNNFYLISFYMHVILGSVALAIGPFQFFDRLRKWSIRTHKIVGKTYVLCCLLAGLTSLKIAFYTEGGVIATCGFLSLGIVWIGTTSLGWIYAKKGKIDDHKKWMIASFSLTFAAVTLRVWIGVLIGALSFDYTAAFKIVSWLCWIPNLLISWLIVRRIRK